jgi:hypothetical protein
MRSSTALRLALLVLAIAMTAPLLLPTLLRGLRPYIPLRASSLARTLIPFSNSLAITSTNSFQRFTSTSTAKSNHNSNSNQPTHRNHGLQPLLPRRRRPPPQHLHPQQVLPDLRRPHRSNRLPARQRRPLVLQLSVLPPRPLAERRARQVLGHCPRRSQGYCA